MKYLLTQLIILIGAVTILYYFSTLSYFLPLDRQGSPNWYNVSVVLLLIFLATQAFISIMIFLSQKFVAFGWKEFPDRLFSLKWGVGLSLGLVFLLVLNIFHLFSLPWGVLIMALIAIAIIFLA